MLLTKKALKTGLTNTSYLVVGNILGQIMALVFTVYIARKLGPSEFGIYNTVAAFVTMFSFITLAGYQKVMVREHVGQTHLLQKNICNILALTTLFSVFAVLATVLLSLLINYDSRIIVFIGIYSCTLIFNNVSNLLQVVFYSHNEMKYITYAGFIQRLFYIIPAAVCIYLGSGVNALVISFTLSTFLNIFVNYFFAVKFFSFRLNTKAVLTLSLDHRLFKQALFFSFLGFISYFFAKIDIVMLSWFTDQKSVGIYSAAYKLIVPVQMVGRMMALSFFPLFVEKFKKGKQVKASQLYLASLAIAVVLVPVSLLITLFSDHIVSIAFGIEYLEAVPVLKYLCWVLPLGIITWPFILAMQANHHEKRLILPNILRALSNIILNYIFITKYGYIGVVYSTIITYVWYMILVNFGYHHYILKKYGNII